VRVLNGGLLQPGRRGVRWAGDSFDIELSVPRLALVAAMRIEAFGRRKAERVNQRLRRR